MPIGGLEPALDVRHADRQPVRAAVEQAQAKAVALAERGPRVCLLQRLALNAPLLYRIDIGAPDVARGV
jgi:hypothetical protein